MTEHVKILRKQALQKRELWINNFIAKIIASEIIKVQGYSQGANPPPNQTNPKLQRNKTIKPQTNKQKNPNKQKPHTIKQNKLRKKTKKQGQSQKVALNNNSSCQQQQS